jgi:hypothetical protein
MIKRIVQKIKTKKMEKLENFFQSGYMKKEKKCRLRAFARTRAKKQIKIYDNILSKWVTTIYFQTQFLSKSTSVICQK